MHRGQLGGFQHIRAHLCDVDAGLPVLRSGLLPGLGAAQHAPDLVLPVRNLHKGVLAVAEVTEDGGGDGRVADCPVFVEYTVDGAPALFDDHQLPDAPAHSGLHMLFERDVVGVGAGHAAHLAVEHLLAHLRGEGLRLGDGVAHHIPRLGIVVELEDVGILRHLDHTGDLFHSDGQRGVGVELLEEAVHQLAVLKVGVLHPPVQVGLVHQVPHHQVRFILQGGYEVFRPRTCLRDARGVREVPHPAAAAHHGHHSDATLVAFPGEILQARGKLVTQFVETLPGHEDADHIQLQALRQVEVEAGFFRVVLHPGVDVVPGFGRGGRGVVEAADLRAVDGVFVRFLHG